MSENKEEPASMDSILNDIGEFGKYQKIVLIFIAFPICFNAILLSEFIFTAASTQNRCLIPGCDDGSSNYNESWLERAIPKSDSNSFDQCTMYKYEANHSSIVYAGGENDTCESSYFDRDKVIECSSYVYSDDYSSINREFDLACQEWKKSSVGIIKMIGFIFGLPLSGFLSDRFGRRFAVVFHSIGMCIPGIMRAFSVNMEMFLALEFLEAFFGGGLYEPSFLLVTEVMVSSRSTASAVISIFYSMGEIIVGAIAWISPSWRYFLLIVYVPQLLTILYLWLLRESIPWLVSKGKVIDAEKVLQEAAKTNQMSISSKSLESLHELSSSESRFDKSNLDDLYADLLMYPAVILRLIIITFCWFSVMLLCMGVTISMATINENIYLNFILASLVEIPSTCLAYISMKYLKNIKTLFLGFIISGVACLVVPFVPKEWEWISIALLMVSKGCIIGSLVVLYVYTAEVTPTMHRNKLMSLCTCIGRIGLVVAPFMPALSLYWKPIPYLSFGTVSVLAALLVISQPEAGENGYPDTMEKCASIGSGRGFSVNKCGSVEKTPKKELPI